MRAKTCLVALLILPLWVASVHAAAVPWDDFARDFVERTFEANPSLAVFEGRHEFDGRVPDFSRNGIRKEIARLHAARSRAAAYPDDALTTEQRFERDYVMAVIDRDLFGLEKLRWPFRSPGYYFWLDPQVYISRDYAPLAQRMRAYVSYAKAVPRAVDQMRANLQGPLPRSYIRLGHILAGGLASLYEKDVPRIFASVDDRALQAEFRRANAPAIAAMKGLDAWFTRAERRATDDFALGPRLFAGMLQAGERIDVPIGHLKEIGERDLARNLDNLKTACQALAPGQPLDACVRDVLAQKAPDDVLQVAKDQLGGLRGFVADHHLVSIPSADVVKVEETPPHQRWSSASISIPGPFDTKVESIYYITPPDPNWSKEERDAYVPGKYLLPFISTHEVWPGHFLQFLHARQSKSTIGRVFNSYAFSEGWAHYCEELMWDAGVAGTDPAAHVAQIAEALLRDVRLLAAIGMHTGGMTVDQAATMFRDKAFQDAASARKEADRGTFDPGYGAYTLGKLTILKLREDWTASRGGRDAWQAFHDQLLSYGAPPLPLVRKAMLGPNAGPSL